MLLEVILLFEEHDIRTADAAKNKKHFLIKECPGE
jgi:hypothetical protein